MYKLLNIALLITTSFSVSGCTIPSQLFSQKVVSEQSQPQTTENESVIKAPVVEGLSPFLMSVQGVFSDIFKSISPESSASSVDTLPKVSSVEGSPTFLSSVREMFSQASKPGEVASTTKALNAPVFKSTSALVRSVLKVPNAAKSIAAALAAKAQVSVAETQKATKVDMSASTGLNDEANDSIQGVAIATVTARKILDDNGQTDRAILLSKLTAKGAVIEAHLSVDKALQTLIQAHDSKVAAEKTIQIIDYYLEIYNARENLVLSAVKAGVLSKSDHLELRSLRNGTVADRSKAVLVLSKADSSLKNMMKLEYKAAVSDLVNRHDESKSPKFYLAASPRQKLLDLRLEKLKLEVQVEQSRNTPTSQWQASLSSPQTENSSATLFAGVRFGFSVKDGGEAAAKIDVLMKQLAVTELDLEMYALETTLAQEDWNSFLDYYSPQKSLLIESKEISEQRIEELELRLKAGRADVSGLAREILVSAKAEIALLQLKTEYLSRRVTAAAVTGQTCGLLALCDAITASLPKN